MLFDSRVIECPIRRAVVPTLECHSCPNGIRVLFRSEYPPELQCAVWRRLFDIDETNKEEETEN